MCGIAGATRVSSDVLDAMVARLAHRGPDDRGTWRDTEGGPALGHTRLAVIDLSPGGHQPMASPCGRWVLAYNGEIYNYRALRADLEARGETFASHSDTEVLLAAYRAHLEWEETHFFPAAEAALTAADWQAVSARFAAPDDPLAANPVDKRYSALFRAIADAAAAEAACAGG